MHTEEQARKLWCPMARCGNDAGCNRGGGDFASGPYCIGSQCLMWRWLDDGKVRTYEDPNCDSWTKKPRMGNDFTITYYWEKDAPNRRGYCGLAGKPEV